MGISDFEGGGGFPRNGSVPDNQLDVYQSCDIRYLPGYTISQAYSPREQIGENIPRNITQARWGMGWREAGALETMSCSKRPARSLFFLPLLFVSLLSVYFAGMSFSFFSLFFFMDRRIPLRWPGARHTGRVACR